MAPRRRTDPKDDATKSAAQQGPDREGLLTALGKLRPALRTGGAIPELGHMWFEAGRVSAYDGGLGIRLTTDLGLACGAPGRPLLGLLGTSSLKQVSFEQEEGVLVVRMGKSRTKLNVLACDRDPWPYPQDHGRAAKLSVAAVEALRAALIVKASPATRLEHHGVALYCAGADVDIYATDSRTLVQSAYSEKGTGLPKFVFLPRPLVEQIVALCPHGAELYVCDDHLGAAGDGVELCSNVLDTTGLIDIPALFAKYYKTHPDEIPLPAGLEAVLDRAEVLAGAEGAAFVTIAIRGKKFSLSGKYHYGELREELVLEKAHPDVDLAVSTAALRCGLLAADAFSATAGSFAFYGGDNFLYLAASRA